MVVVSKLGVSLSRTSPLPRESRPAGRRALQGPSHAPAPAPRRHRCPAVSSLAQRPRRVAVTAGGGSSRSDPLLLPLFLHTAGKRSRPKGTSEVLGRRAGARGLSLRSLTGVGAAPARPTRGHCFFAEDCGLGAPLASLPQVGQEKGQRPALQRGVSPRGQQSRDPMLGGQREMTQTDRQTDRCSGKGFGQKPGTETRCPSLPKYQFLLRSVHKRLARAELRHLVTPPLIVTPPRPVCPMEKLLCVCLETLSIGEWRPLT